MNHEVTLSEAPGVKLSAKEKKRLYNQRYYAARRDELVARQAEYNKAHRAQTRKSSSEYYHKNKDACQARHRRYRAENKESLAKKQADRFQRFKVEQPDKYREQRTLSNLRRRGLRILKRLNANLLRQKFDFHGGRCAYCRVSLSYNRMHWDHKKPCVAGGSSHLSNLIPSCATCNLRKADNWQGVESWMNVQRLLDDLHRNKRGQ